MPLEVRGVLHLGWVDEPERQLELDARRPHAEQHHAALEDDLREVQPARLGHARLHQLAVLVVVFEEQRQEHERQCDVEAAEDVQISSRCLQRSQPQLNDEAANDDGEAAHPSEPERRPLLARGE